MIRGTDIISTEEAKSEPVMVKLSALATANSHKILDQLLDMTFDDDDDNNGSGSSGGFMTKSSSPKKISSSLSSKQSMLLDDLLTVPVSTAVAVDCQVVETNTTYEAIYDAEKDEEEGVGQGGALTINPSSTNRMIGNTTRSIDFV